MPTVVRRPAWAAARDGGNAQPGPVAGEAKPVTHKALTPAQKQRAYRKRHVTGCG